MRRTRVSRTHKKETTANNHKRSKCISTNNIEVTIIRQIVYRKKARSDVVIEVGEVSKKILLQKKIKLGSQICKIDDYIVATRC